MFETTSFPSPDLSFTTAVPERVIRLEGPSQDKMQWKELSTKEISDAGYLS